MSICYHTGMKKILKQYLIKTLQQAAVALALHQYGAAMMFEDVEDELIELGLSPDISPCDISAIIHYNLEQYGQITPDPVDCFTRAGIAMYALNENPANVSLPLLNIASNKLSHDEYNRIEQEILEPLGAPITISHKEYIHAAQEILEEFNEIGQEM